MILGGAWYYRVEGAQGTNFSYRLFTNDGPMYIYFHLVVKSKIPNSPMFAKQKGDPMFSRVFELSDNLATVIEDLGSLLQIDINKETPRSIFFIW
jgi:hypothetical protein